MTADDLRPAGGDAAGLFAAGQPLADAPPLWWFVLREAEVHGANGGLAGVGARLLAETVVRAVEASETSVLRDHRIDLRLPGGDGSPATMVGILSAFGQLTDWYRGR